MATIETKELRRALMPFSEDVRAKLAQPNIAPVVEASLVWSQRVLYHLFNFLQNVEKGETGTMDKLVSSLKVEVVRLGDLPARERESKWRPIVKEFCEALEDRITKWEANPKRKEEDYPIQRIPTDQIAPTHFWSVMRKLINAGDISPNFKMVTRNKQHFLVKPIKEKVKA